MQPEFTLTVTVAEDDIAEARRIRIEVFADEQGIPVNLDDDGLDGSAFHVLCRANGEIIGTGRLVKETESKGILGRIAIRSEYRSRGLGSLIVKKLESVATQEKLTTLSLQPHKHLEGFYRRLGYHIVPGTEFVAGHELLTMCKEME